MSFTLHLNFTANLLLSGEAQLVKVQKIKRDYPEILNNDKKLQLESRIEYVAKQKGFENVAIKNSRRK